MGYYNHYIIAVKTRTELKNQINCRNQCLQLLIHLFFTNCRHAQKVLGSLLSNYFESKKNKPTNKRTTKKQTKIKPFVQFRLFLQPGCCLRWLDTVFQGQYLPSFSINYVAINKVSKNCHHSCIRWRWKFVMIRVATA